MRTHSHLAQFSVADSHADVFWGWEEAREPGANPHAHFWET